MNDVSFLLWALWLMSESFIFRTYEIPWFNIFCKDVTTEYAVALTKVVDNHRELLAGDAGNTGVLGCGFYKLVLKRN